MRIFTLGFSVLLMLTTVALASEPELILPEGMADKGCEFSFLPEARVNSLPVSSIKPVNIRRFHFVSEQSIGQALRFLASAPAFKLESEFGDFAQFIHERLGSPRQWIDHTPTSTEIGPRLVSRFIKEVELSENSSVFRPVLAEWQSGVRMRQKIQLDAPRDIVWGTLRWPNTKLSKDDAPILMKVNFQNRELGKFLLEVSFESPDENLEN